MNIASDYTDNIMQSIIYHYAAKGDKMIVTAFFSDYDLAESAAHIVREHLPSIACLTRCEDRDALFRAAQDSADWSITDNSFSDRTVSELFLVQSALFSGSLEELREPEYGRHNAMFSSPAAEPFRSNAVVIAKGSKRDVDIAANILRSSGSETVRVYGEHQ